MSEEDLAALRREYGEAGLDLPDLADDPITMFRGWLADAVAAGLHEPNAMVVASATPEGVPSARLVLLKGLDERGFCFYTNYDSRKGRELGSNPPCSLVFPWHDLQRQVRVDGIASKVSEQESAAYFATRPREARLGAWASPQSQMVPSRADLDARYAAVERRFREQEVGLPPAWGGYVVRPDVVEFWQGRRGRMHDRLVFRRTPDGWRVERLAP